MNGGTQNLTNVVLTGNKTAFNGGAIYNGNGYTNCTFCTISGNYATGKGGGIYLNANYTATLKNSVVFNNDAGTPTDANYKQIETSYRWSYVDVYNTLINQAPGSGTGNPRLSYEDLGGNLQPAISPAFVSPLNPASAPTADGNYRLQSSSPAIGAASSSWTVDHDIFGIGRTQGGTYDMGADEYGSPGTDTTNPASSITAPASGATISRATQNPYTITGSVSDNVAVSGVEVSTDNGSTWHNASTIGYPGITGTWTYKWTLPANGSYTIRSRATDSSDNIEIPGAGNTVTVGN